SRSDSSVSRLVTSAVRRSVLRPAASIASALSAPPTARRAAPTTTAPAAARPRLIARPIPDVPPRTTAVRPSRFSADAGADGGPDTTPAFLPPHAGRQGDHVRVRHEVCVVDGRVAHADQRIRAVEPVRILDDDLIGRLTVGAPDDTHRDHTH